MALADIFNQNQFDPAAYQTQLLYNQRLRQQQEIDQQTALQKQQEFARQQQVNSELDTSIQGKSPIWYTDAAIQAASQQPAPAQQEMPQQGMSQQSPALSSQQIQAMMTQQQPMSQQGAAMPLPQQAPVAPQQAPVAPQQRFTQQQMAPVKTWEAYQLLQQQADKQRALIDGQAKKYLDILGKTQETNPDLAKKVGTWLEALPGWEQVGEAIKTTEFGIPNQKIVFGSQLEKLSPAEKAAIGELPEGTKVGAFDQFILKRSGNAYSLKEFKPDPREGKRSIKSVMRDGKPTLVMFDNDGNEVNDLGDAATNNAGRYVSTDEDVKKWADAVRANRVTIDKVPAYGGLRARVLTEVEKASGGNPVHYTGDIAGAKSAATSQSFVTKQLDMSQSFISTIDSNIMQFKEHIDDMATRKNIDRNKIMNMGVRTFQKSVLGDSDINIYDMLINAISTETAKLVSGGAGSVAQVAEGARLEMEKIHNKNMPIKDMLKLLEATRREGENRISALTKQVGVATERTRQTRSTSSEGKVQTQSKSGVDVGKFVGKDKRNGKSVYRANGKYFYEDGTEVM